MANDYKNQEKYTMTGWIEFRLTQSKDKYIIYN
jgi:hypothetical protein